MLKSDRFSCSQKIRLKRDPPVLRAGIMQHMSQNELFSPLHHGFIGGRSCTTQLIRVLDNCTRILEDGGSVDSIYLDFKKAFDSVPHECLLRKHEGYGITKS